MSSPITPDPSIHSLPAAAAQQQRTQNAQMIEASASNLFSAIIKAILNILTGGAFKGNSSTAGGAFYNLFTNLFNMLGR